MPPIFSRVLRSIDISCGRGGEEPQERLPHSSTAIFPSRRSFAAWNTDHARRRADALIADEIDKAITKRDDFGIETTYTDEPSRALVERAKAAGYRIRGYFIGTETRAINIERIHGHVEADKQALRRHRLGPRDGPWIDPQQVRERHRQALASLSETAGSFDELVILDNSAETSGRPEPTTALILEDGRVSYETDRLARWVAAWRAQLPREEDNMTPAELDVAYREQLHETLARSRTA